MEPQKEQRKTKGTKKMLRGGTTKKQRKTKGTKKIMLGGGTTKGTKNTKDTKKIMLGGGTTKKQSKVDGVGVLRALARSATKAPKLKKT